MARRSLTRRQIPDLSDGTLKSLNLGGLSVWADVANPTGSGLRTVIYARISDDASGTAEGVLRQLVDCRNWAGRDGLRVVAIAVDDDLSAAKLVNRPAFDEALNAYDQRTVDAIMVWKLDRLARRQADLSRVLERTQRSERDQNPLRVYAHDGLSLDGSPSSSLIAQLLTSVAGFEADMISARVRAALLHRRRRGLPSGHRRRYGWETDGVTLRPEEADVLRQAARQVMEGATLSQVVRDLNHRGLLAAGGSRWTPGKLGRALRRPAMAGLLRDLDNPELLVRGQIEPILDREEWERLVDTLDGRPTRGPGKGLLAGLVFCACGRGPMRYAMVPCGPPERRRKELGLRCPAHREPGVECGRARLAKFLEPWAAHWAAAAVTSPDIPQVGASTTAELAELEARLQEVEEILRTDVDAPLGPLIERRRRILERINTIMEQQPRSGSLEAVRAGHLRDAERWLEQVWDRLSVAERNDVLRLLLGDQVFVIPDPSPRREEGALDVMTRAAAMREVEV